jgi:8-oxo-dGTP diphosphatase
MNPASGCQPPGERPTVRAAGFVLVRGEGPSARFLLLHNPEHREWGFAKGHLDPGEEDLPGALRELREETGIVEVEIDPAFRETIRYEKVSRKTGARTGVWKEVVYFFGRSKDEAHTLSEEHDRSGWFTLAEARERIPHENLRGVLQAAGRRAGAI